MLKQSTFVGEHFVMHLNKGREGLNKDNLRDHPYQIVLSSEYAHPPMSESELRQLINFINRFLESNNE
jgi:hypothetical protein